MTKEDAINILNDKAFAFCDIMRCANDYNGWTCKECDEALIMAKEALRQKSCEDAVSREAVLEKAYAYGNGLEPEGYCVEVEDIQALPPVTPTRKKGKWYIREYDLFTCDQCGKDVQNGAEYTQEAREMLENGDFPNYCPNCGTDMRGDEND